MQVFQFDIESANISLTLPKQKYVGIIINFESSDILIELLIQYLDFEYLRYVICGGINCEAIHDTLDELASVRFDETLMTTWHKNATPEDIVHYARWNAFFFENDMVPEMWIFFFLGKDQEKREQYRQEIQKLFAN